MDISASPPGSAGGVRVAADADRFGRPAEFLDARFTVLVSREDSGGAICAVDTDRRKPGGPPMHLHHAQDEWFFVRAGDFEVRVGDETFHLSPGDSLFAPRGVPHAFANRTETGRMLVTFAPAGEMERFFREAGEIAAPGPEEMAALFRSCGMEIVGPPLPV